MLSAPFLLLLAILAPSMAAAVNNYSATVTVDGEEYEITSEGNQIEIDIDEFLAATGLEETNKLETINIHTPEGATSITFNFGELLSTVFWDQEIMVVDEVAQLSLPAVLKDADSGSDGVAFMNLVQMLHPFNGELTFDAVVNYENGEEDIVTISFVTAQGLELPGDEQVDVTSFTLITKDGREIEAFGQNSFAINLITESGNTEITAVKLTSPNAKSVSLFSKTAVFYGDALDVQFVDGVAMLTTSHFEFDPELAEIVGSDKPHNLFTVQELKEVIAQLGNQTVSGIVADAHGNESFFDVSFQTYGWAKVDGKWYYYDELGNVIKGWLNVGDDWFYLHPVTGVMQTGWIDYKGKKYYMNLYGFMQTGFVNVDGKTYYFNHPDGDLRTVEGWFALEGKWHYLNKDGSLVKGWKYAGGKHYYFDNNGKMLEGPRWLTVDGKKFYLDANDAAVKGWSFLEGKWYFFDKTNGVMKTGWLFDGGKWYFLENSGAMKTGWLWNGSKWYFLENSGAMKTGWLFNGGKWYFLENSGAMKTGWLSNGGSWYYHNASGAMMTGWVQVSNKWYYFYSSGRMASNTTIDGYRLGKDGAWIR